MTTAAFAPFGSDYRAGVSLSTGWLAGSLGGAKRIVVGQLAEEGAVKVYSSGSALDEGPAMYLHSPTEHGHGAAFRAVARFNPFAGASGVRVATTSTTAGASLLVSGVSLKTRDARVHKYDFVRSKEQPTLLEAVRLGEVGSGGGSQPAHLGGE